MGCQYVNGREISAEYYILLKARMWNSNIISVCRMSSTCFHSFSYANAPKVHT